MRGFLRAALAAVLLGTLLVGPAGAQQPGQVNEATLLDELGRSRVERHAETGQLRFAGGTNSRPSAGRERLGKPANPRAAARAYLKRYGRLFGVQDAANDLRLERTIAGGPGRTFFRFRQSLGGVPVLAGELTVQVDDQGNVISAIGEATPAHNVATQPTISRAEARRIAVAHAARDHDLARDQFNTSEPELLVYDPALIGPGKLPHARLAWRLEVRQPSAAINDFVLIDATDGVVVLRFNQLAHAKNRRVCDADGGYAHDPCVSAARSEGGGATGIADVDKVYDYAGHTYDFFFNRFGRDSLDAAGMPLVATARFCEGGCVNPNAYWYDGQAYFWPGMAADDVVAHEFVHGFTERTSNLLYVYQSGAINEAISDIFGEFIDLTNGAGNDTPGVRWLMGEDTAPVMGPIRSMANPPTYQQPDRMRSSLYWSREWWDPYWDNGGVHVNSGVANKAAFLMVDGGSFNGQTVSGIGIDKTAAVWYRTAVNYLSSGSDFEDLGTALSQACGDLVGSSVKDSTGAATGSISSTDCSQVAKAVLATEMALQPTVAGAALPEAPKCTSGTPQGAMDPIAAGHPGWTATNSRWTSADTYATTKPYHLWGRTPSSAGAGGIYWTNALTVPSGGFLHFRHAYFFDNYLGTNYDGGIVEYQVGSGAWVNAKNLFSHNGYNGTIATYSGGGNPFAGQQAFVGYSKGYYSSRLNLSSLAGQNVRFRFRTGTDSSFADYGWFIDDVLFYRCVSASDTTPPTVTPPNTNFLTGVNVATTKKNIRLTTSFSATDASGISKTALQRRKNTGSWSSNLLSSATATSRNQKFPTSASNSWQYRARATDTKGNKSAWVSGPAFKVLVQQDGSAGVTQSGSWSVGSNSNFYGGSVRHSASAGAKQSRTANVFDFAVVSTKGPNRGRADVYVDGVYQATIDLYASTTQYRQVVYAVDFGAAGTHTIELRVTGTKNSSSSGSRVDFDAFLSLAP